MILSIGAASNPASVSAGGRLGADGCDLYEEAQVSPRHWDSKVAKFLPGRHELLRPLEAGGRVLGRLFAQNLLERGKIMDLLAVIVFVQLRHDGGDGLVVLLASRLQRFELVQLVLHNLSFGSFFRFSHVQGSMVSAYLMILPILCGEFETLFTEMLLHQGVHDDFLAKRMARDFPGELTSPSRLSIDVPSLPSALVLIMVLVHLHMQRTRCCVRPGVRGTAVVTHLLMVFLDCFEQRRHGSACC